MRVQISAKYGYTWRLQYCFKNGPLTENGNSAKKRAGNETAASPANGNGNGKPEFENGATLVATILARCSSFDHDMGRFL